MTPQVALAYAKLTKAHKACKALYGAEFDKKVSEWEPILRAVMKKENIELLPAAINVASAAVSESAFAAMIVLAVACEIIEREK